eukprot:Hpha_TRINITY_DN16196_c3_g1::TRINITY_DN16196_c3_g1_i1::g.8073::m.8073
MPLRVEAVDKDETPLAWRHRTLQEFFIARSMVEENSVSRLKGGSLEHAPQVCSFFTERLRAMEKLHPERATQLTTYLYDTSQVAVGQRAGNSKILLCRALAAAGSPGARLPPLSPEETPVDGSRRLCVGVCCSVEGAETGWELSVVPLAADGRSVRKALSSAGERSGSVTPWLVLSGNATWGPGDPFFDLSALVTLEEVPPEFGALRFLLM